MGIVIVVGIILFLGLSYVYHLRRADDPNLMDKLHEEHGDFIEKPVVIYVSLDYIDDSKGHMTIELFLPTIYEKILHPSFKNNSKLLGEYLSPAWGVYSGLIEKHNHSGGYRKRIKLIYKKDGETNLFSLKSKIKLRKFISILVNSCYNRFQINLKITENILCEGHLLSTFYTEIESRNKDFKKWYNDDQTFPGWITKKEGKYFGY